MRSCAVSTQVGLTVLRYAMLRCAVLCCAVTLRFACWIAAEHPLKHFHGLDNPLLASIETPLLMQLASKEATLLLHQLHVIVHALITFGSL